MYETLLGWMQFLGGSAPGYVNKATVWMQDNSSLVALLGIGALVIGMGVATHWRTSPRLKLIDKLRGKRMTGQAREAEVRVLLSDGITDFMEQLRIKGKISDEELYTWYDRFGNLLDLRDLISAKRLTLKQSLRMSKKKRDNRIKNGIEMKTVPIPDVPVKPKNAFDALIKRSTKTA